MLRAAYLTITLVVAGLLILGCSGTGGDYTTTPNIIDTTANSTNHDSQRMLWGIWNISFDPAEMTVTVEPIRNAQAHFNIIDMVTPPECYDCLEIAVNSFDPVTRIMDVDVTLRNQLGIAGRDVRGILFTNDYGHELRNANDWTGLWDVPGGMDINPFKAFAKIETSRIFAGFAVHTEKYFVYIPTPPNFSAITYAVDASWPGNCKDPYAIDSFMHHTEIYDGIGSTGILHIEVLEWQADVDSVMLSAPEITGQEYVEFTLFAGNYVWHLDLTNAEGAPAGEYVSLVKATSTNSGELALYDYVTVIITEYPYEGWARTWGGAGWDQGNGVAVDDSGNAYVTGDFSDWDISLSKFDSEGNPLWTRVWGGQDEDYGFSVDVDSAGNAYATGFYWFTCDFDPGPGVVEHTSAGAGSFISKFDPDGIFQWVRVWDGGVMDRGAVVAVDDSGNAYITGKFIGTVDFDPGLGVDEHSSDDGPIYLSKFNSDGDFQWVLTWGAGGWGVGSDVAVDNSNNVFVFGGFNDTIDFDPGPGVEEHTGTWDVFVSKFDSNGEFQWARTWGGAEIIESNGIVADDFGGVYTIGFFWGTQDFDPGTGIDEHASTGSVDIFLSKLDANGDFQWAQTWGGTGVEIGHGVSVDDSGDVFTTGRFDSETDFDPGIGTELHAPIGWDDAFVCKFNSTGEFQWVRTWGMDNQEHGLAVATDGLNNIYVTGLFGDTVDFNPGPGVEEHTSNGVTDSFLCKFKPDGYW